MPVCLAVSEVLTSLSSFLYSFLGASLDSIAFSMCSSSMILTIFWCLYLLLSAPRMLIDILKSSLFSSISSRCVWHDAAFLGNESVPILTSFVYFWMMMLRLSSSLC